MVPVADRVQGVKRATRPEPRHGLGKDVLRRRLLAAADAGGVVTAGVVAGIVEGTPEATAMWVSLLVPVWIVLAKLLGLYGKDHSRLRHQSVDEVATVFHWATLSSAATLLFLGAVHNGVMGQSGVLSLWATAFVGTLVIRAAVRLAWRMGTPPDAALLVGGGELADAVARKLVLEPGHHLTVARRVSLHSEPEVPANGAGRFPRSPIALGRLEADLQSGIYDRLILAVQDLDEPTMARLVACCRRVGVKLSVVPPMRGMFGTAVELSHMADLPLIEFRTWDPSRSTMAMKRIVDATAAAVVLLVLSPLLLAIAALVRLDSKGPAVFRQRRAGLGGKPFSMLKFRTMVDGADGMVADVLDLQELTDPMFKVRDDPRVTRVGRFLRRASLDELPQLWNVLRGDMSLVGPRPEELWLVERYGEEERFRLEMRPGLTGPMQVHGRGELDFAERLAVEREYMDGYSLGRDFAILLQTVSVVTRGRGAF